MSEVDDVVARLDAATEGVTTGPWRADDMPITMADECETCGYVPDNERSGVWSTTKTWTMSSTGEQVEQGVCYDCLHEPDAAFIAASRSLIPEAADTIRAIDEAVRPALMWLEEVILSLPDRWNDPLVPPECAPTLRAAYRALSVSGEAETGQGSERPEGERDVV